MKINKWIISSCALIYLIFTPLSSLASTTPSLKVAPDNALVDTRLTITASGLKPGQQAIIRAQLTDQAGNVWASWGKYKADKSGNIDTAYRKPSAGTFDVADTMAFVYSMLPVVKKGGTIPEFLWTNVTKPIVMDVSLEIDGKKIVSKKVTRIFMSKGVTRQVILTDKLHATFFKSPIPGKRPGVMVLHGSGGGRLEDHAALLASHGYSALAITYFGEKGLPANLTDVPVELVGNAIKWMQNNANVDPNKIAIMGRSKGGELSILSASIYPQIKAVIAVVPSGVAFQGLTTDKNSKAVRSTWTYKGKEVAFVPFKMSARFLVSSILSGMFKTPLATEPYFSSSMRQKAEVVKAEFAVEKINGPVMLFSAKKDAVWPSYRLCKMIMERMEKNGQRYSNIQKPYEHAANVHRAYEHAGHNIKYPYQPTSINFAFNKASAINLAWGGNAQANADASFDSWGKILGFLDRSIGGK